MIDPLSLLDDIAELPTLPAVIGQLNRLILDPRTSASTINNVLSRDMALSAKILKQVNSSFYGFPRRITTITYAVVILGFSKIRDIALSAFVLDAFRFHAAGFDLRQFWRHALAVAVSCQTLASISRDRRDDDAFMAGLLHDVGKAVLAQFRPLEFAEALRRARAEDRLLREAEMELLDFDHARIGGALMERWNLPASLVAVVAGHHEPERAAAEHARLTALTHFADILARSLLLGHPGDAGLPTLSAEAWETTGLSWRDVEGAIPDIQARVNHSDSFFGA